jgi:trehalose 6-phosphate synthase
LARLLIVSNRIALPGEQAARAGGLAVAIREALRKYGGIWIGWSGETVDEAEDELRIQASGSGRISVATLDLTKEEQELYYAGFSNSVLWPLCHYRVGLMDFKRPYYTGYMAVNDRFAAAVARIARPDDIIWVHDYHFLPLAAALRRRGLRNRIGFFLHIPFPAPEVLRVVPFHERLVADMCDYDLLGFQTASDERAFCDFIRHDARGVVGEDGSVTAFNRVTRTGVYPVGIETERFALTAIAAELGPETKRLMQSLTGRKMVIGVDRLDYSKGLPLRFDAYSSLLANYPQHRAKVVMMQIAPTSRNEVRQYRALRRELDQLAGRINARYAEFDWAPLRYLNRGFSRNTLAGFYRYAHVGLVTPLRDGMNLVAKEFVAAQNPDNPGVLVLSRFAGAVDELCDGAKLVNPFDVDGVGEAMHEALIMPLEERKRRYEAMMKVLQANTINDWYERFLAALRGAN